MSTTSPAAEVILGLLVHLMELSLATDAKQLQLLENSRVTLLDKARWLLEGAAIREREAVVMRTLASKLEQLATHPTRPEGEPR